MLVIERKVVKDKMAASALLSAEGRKILFHFFSNPMHIKFAAERLGLTFQQTYYKILRLKKLGLLVESGEVHFSGRKRKLYETAANVFEIPYEYTKFESLSSMMYELSSFKRICVYTEAAFKESYKGSWKIELTKNTKISDNYLAAGFGPSDLSMYNPNLTSPVYGAGSSLRLTLEDANMLVEDLKKLKEKYTLLSQDETQMQSYFLTLNLVTERY